jgi:hypothetical protein
MAFYFVSTFAIAQTPTKQPALRLSRTKNLHFAKATFPGFSANEFGFFFKGDQLAADLKKVFADLKAKSYRWGNPEWLEMRKQLMVQDSSKASTTRKQRGLYKSLSATGLKNFSKVTGGWYSDSLINRNSELAFKISVY